MIGLIVSFLAFISTTVFLAWLFVGSVVYIDKNGFRDYVSLVWTNTPSNIGDWVIFLGACALWYFSGVYLFGVMQ